MEVEGGEGGERERERGKNGQRCPNRQVKVARRRF